MSFRQLGLFRKKGAPSPTGVAVGTIHQKHGNGLGITVRPDVAQDLGWTVGTRVGVAIGEGTDEGLLCLYKADDGLKLYGPEGTKWGGRVTVNAIHLPVEITVSRPAEDVAFERKDGALVIVLPTWAYQVLPPVPLKSFRVVDNRTRTVSQKAVEVSA